MPGGVVPGTRQSGSTRGPLNSQSAEALRSVMYVNQVGDDGWLQAMDDLTGRRISLCKYTRVTNIQSKNGRTSFKVQEGTGKGRILSLSDANAKLYLGNKGPTLSGIVVTVVYGPFVKAWVSKAKGELIDQQMATMTVGSLTVDVTMNSVWGAGYSPLPAGEYPILLPDVPHRAGYTRFYRQSERALVHDQVWFPIKFEDNSRYVHVGNVSDGCVTVLNLAKWSQVQEALISHRQDGGSVGVGKLVVKGKPERVG
jgi:hypothetical protein